MTATDDALAQLNILLSEYNGFDHRPSGPQKNQDATKLVYRLQAAVERLTAPASSYAQDLKRTRELRFTNSISRMIAVAAIASALRDDISAGWLSSIVELVHADTYADYLTMADGLVAQHYKDAAAVIAGTSLEVHLKALAVKHGVALQLPSGSLKKMDAVNAELKSAAIYNGIEQKQVTAWLDLRNRAAHGEYDKYDEGMVRALVAGVGDFAVRHPA